MGDGNMARKKVAPMWRVKNSEGKNVFFHVSDFERAGAYGTPKEVYVIMDSDYFIGTWQFEETISGYVGMYDSMFEAEEGMIFIGGYRE